MRNVLGLCAVAFALAAWVDTADAGCRRRCERAAQEGRAACEEAFHHRLRQCQEECGDNEECLRVCRARAEAEFQACLETVECGLRCCNGYCEAVAHCREECGDNRECYRRCKRAARERAAHCFEECHGG